MGDKTGIQWTDATWNPVTGCTKVSAGCKHCYAEKVFPRAYSKDVHFYHPVPGSQLLRRRSRKFTDVKIHEDRLDQPLRWRKPRRVFVNSMSDLFHEDVPDEFIESVFDVMKRAERHTFQVLTKRPERMREWFNRRQYEPRCHYYADGTPTIPSRNVWIGVSVEDQETADERIPLFLDTPAAVRFVSYEPALAPVDFQRVTVGGPRSMYRANALTGDGFDGVALDWVIVGGESGRGARPFGVQWARDTVAQCQAAGVPVFVKQLGANVTWNGCAGPDEHWPKGTEKHDTGEGHFRVILNDRKGGDMDEWPLDLRVREYPAAGADTRA